MSNSRESTHKSRSVEESSSRRMVQEEEESTNEADATTGHHSRVSSAASEPAMHSSSAWASAHGHQNRPVDAPPSPGSRRSAPPRVHEPSQNHHPFRSAATTPDAPSSVGNASRPSEPTQPSIPDRVAASALQATLDLLRIAGGVTLSTTGKLVAPPLYVTKTILLPNLWAATVDYISTVTPQRVKDWFRIVSTSIYHFVSVLRSTARGKIFRQRFLTAYFDLVDCLSSDNARQVLIDGMGCSVKLAEALRTPETKLLLDQLAVLGCRLVDFAASGKNQELIHDVSTLFWSGCELLADPSTTLALAEVTAYLCHALEMEDAGIHNITDEQPPADHATRRHERDTYQRSTYVDPAMLTDPETTVEQVILSSLGMPKPTNPDGETDGGLPRVPSNVVLEVQDWERSSSILQQVQSQEASVVDEDEQVQEEEEEEEWHERARNDVDIPFLREQITQRASHMERHRTVQTQQGVQRTATYPPTPSSWPPTRPNTNMSVPVQDRRDRSEVEDDDDGDVDVEDLGVVTTVQEDSDQTLRTSGRPRVPLDASSTDNVDMSDAEAEIDDPNWPQIPDAQPLEDETPIHHFHRVLDELLTQKRKEAIDSLLQRDGDKTRRGSSRDGRVVQATWNARAAAAAGAGNERGQDTIKARLAALRSADIGVGKLSKGDREAVEGLVREYGTFVYVAFAGLLLIVLVWIGFGCYGVYSFFYPSVKTSIDMAKSAILKPSSSPAAASQEVVIRIVREVVHVDSKGATLGRGVASTIVSEEGIDKIAECVASAL